MKTEAQKRKRDRCMALSSFLHTLARLDICSPLDITDIYWGTPIGGLYDEKN